MAMVMMTLMPMMIPKNDNYDNFGNDDDCGANVDYDRG